MPYRSEAGVRLLHWVVFGLACLELAVLAVAGWHRLGGGTPLVFRLLGVLLVAASLAGITVARLQLGRAFSVRARATRLVTTGLYARVRNPIYLFSVVGLVGVALYIGSPRVLLLAVPLALVQGVRARNEAKVLRAHFGAAYDAYRRQTWF